METVIKPLQTQEEKPVVPFRPAGAGGLAGLHGEFTADDTQIPIIKIIQAVGKSAAEHPKDHGALLYGNDTLIPRPAILMFYGLDKSYTQNLPFDANSSVKPQVYRSIEEVEAAGGNIDRFVSASEDSRNFVPQAVATVVVESPFKGWASKI